MEPRPGAIRQLRSQPRMSFAVMKKPKFSMPSRFSSGTSQSSNTSSEVTDVRMPVFSMCCPTRKPGKDFSTRKVEMPAARGRASGSVTAVTTNTSPTGPLVIHIFVPLRNQRSPRLTARVFIAAASEPLSGSLRQKPPMSAPDDNPGR